MEQREFFTREVCEVTIDDGVATVIVRSGSTHVHIDMRVSTLMQNMAVCEAALAKWRVAELDKLPATVSRLPVKRRGAKVAH